MKKDDIISNGIVQATVQWVVDYEVGAKYFDGLSVIINIKEDTTWTVTKEAPPTYQTSIDHMTDEQLRTSIEELRRNRIARPAATRMKSVAKEPAMSAQDKQLASILKQKSPEEILALKRKLGLID